MILLFIVILVTGSQSESGGFTHVDGRYISTMATFDTVDRCEVVRKAAAIEANKSAEITLISKCGTKDDTVTYHHYTDAKKPLPAETVARPGA